MQAKIKKLIADAETPKYHTSESAGFDIAAAEDAVIKPGEIFRIRTGLVIQSPPEHFLLIASRSSLSVKKGLRLSNGIGVVDRDYCGPDDEIFIQVYNFTDADVHVKKGERLAQGLFLPVTQCDFVETDEITADSRGGFGSTGGYHG